MADKTVKIGVALLCAAFLLGAAPAQAQMRQARAGSDTEAYSGSVDDALRAAAAGQTIPMNSFPIYATKDGHKYTATMVGSTVYYHVSTTTTWVNVLVVPIVVHIGSTIFDPSRLDACVSHKITPLQAFLQSPLLNPVTYDGGKGAGHAAMINGFNVGPATYPDALRRAEFWWGIQGTDYHVGFKVTVAKPWLISATAVQHLGGGQVMKSDCAPVGILPTDNFRGYIRDTVIPGIPAITPKTFTIFVMKDVVTGKDPHTHCADLCILGYHGAVGSPVKTFAVAEYDSTKHLWVQPGVTDISPLSHEMGAWLDDPLGTNKAPPWGRIGLVGGCETKWEPGDPLNGVNFPAIKMPNGLTYHAQELAFYGWYFLWPGSNETFGGCGAGDKCSMNGTFAGPSRACPPGGTY